MISLIDIQNYIALKLTRKFPTHTIYVEDNKKEIKAPAFRINIMPLETTTYKEYRNKLINVDIAYLSKNETHEENLIMTNDFENLFALMLRVENRRLYIKNLSIREVGGVLHCSLNLDFNQENDLKYEIENDRDLGYDKDKLRYMENLKIKEIEE